MRHLLVLVIFLGGAHCRVPVTGKIVLTSPNYPHPSPANEHVSWILTAPLGSAIKLNAMDFELGAAPSDRCQEQYLRLKDAATGNNIPMGNPWYCGKSGPRNQRVLLEKMIVEFKDHASLPSHGFSIDVESFVEPQPFLHQEAFDLRGLPAEVIFTSPNYPNNYPYATIAT